MEVSVCAARGSHAEAQRRKGLREGGRLGGRGYLGDWEQCVGLGDLREMGVADSWVMAGGILLLLWRLRAPVRLRSGGGPEGHGWRRRSARTGRGGFTVRGLCLMRGEVCLPQTFITGGRAMSGVIPLKCVVFFLSC